MSHALAGRFFTTSITWEAQRMPILTQLAAPRSLWGSQGWGTSEKQVALREFMKELELKDLRFVPALMGTAKKKKKKQPLGTSSSQFMT